MRKHARAGARRPLTSAVAAALLTSLAVGASVGVAASPARAATPSGPDYEMPFPCGDYWNGSSRSYHSPSALAIDWNRDHDLGQMVLASAPGVVTSAVNLGNRSYGRYIIVDHGGGRSTLYAHLSAFWSTTGQAVDQGTPLGLVGSSGGSTGPHLHYEQRLNRADQHSYFTRRWFTMGTTQASRNCGDAPVVGDWNGNGRDNVGVQRRGVSPSFHLRRPGHKSLSITSGWRSDQPLSGDWDGDGKVDIGARRPGLMSFALRNKRGRETMIRLGRVSDFGVAADWNGDGRTDVGVWHPSTQVFTLRGPRGGIRTIRLGSLGDRPVAGDWNGDGKGDIGVYTARTGTFLLRVSNRGRPTYHTVSLGTPSSLPVTGDWNGDKIADLGVWEPSTGMWTLRTTPTKGHPAVILTRHWGRSRG